MTTTLLIAACAVLAVAVALLALRRPAPPPELAVLPDAVSEIRTRLDTLERALDRSSERLERTVRDDGATLRTELATAVQAQRTELATLVQAQRTELTAALQAQRAETVATLERVVKTLDTVRASVETRLGVIQESNEKKLEEMRRTVDEKLQGTLEQRLGESFRLVSERLEAVRQGLGEMQVLATGVGDLKKVLTNVKTRGTWGEVQLGNLLEQVLTRQQYDTNVAVRPGSAERVEFAIRLPGREGDARDCVWLPIDAKFPVEDYQRLVDAAEIGDADGLEVASKALEVRIRGCAQDIRDKYIVPPHTTDFGILFLPTEGLYAEVLRRPGLADALQAQYRVVIAGPTTLAALLNSLQMGFRTLAIEKRSSEVWQLLAAVKTEFGKFGDALGQVKKKLEQATTSIEGAEVRTRAVERKLRDVQALPAADAQALLGPVAELVSEDA